MREFLERLQAEYEKIALNQIGWFEPGLTADEVVSACEKIVRNQKQSRKETDKILSEHLYPMLEDLGGISDEDDEGLFATAQKLSSYEERTDPGLALRIYQKLLERARDKKDEDRIIRYLYWCGITMHFFYRGGLEQEADMRKTLAYFTEGASYADRYYSFSSADTRKYIHRCLGNKSMMYYSLGEPQNAQDEEERIFSFWNSIIYRGKDLDFPWLSYFLACLNHRHGYLAKSAHTEPDKLNKAQLQSILDNSMTINKLYHTNSELFKVFGGTRYDFMLWEAQFLSGLISYDHLAENIHNRKKEFAPDDYSADALYAKITLNSYLMFYAAKMYKLSDRKDEIITSMSRDAIERLSSIPMTVSSSDLGSLLQTFSKDLSEAFDPVRQVEFILEMTTFRHIPTYAHSIIVGKIAVLLTEYLIDNSPESFIGFMGIESPGEVAEKTDDLRKFAYMSGLCHDVGIIPYTSNPFMISRILTDEEFEAIKRHTTDGAMMLSREDVDIANRGYINVIKGHHRFYDNSDGYPNDYDTSDSEYKLMIDVISVANALDSATDNISKIYAEAKTLEVVCDEVISVAGTRYPPFVVNALKDGVLLEKLRNVLNADRRDAYYTAYLHAWGGGEKNK